MNILLRTLVSCLAMAVPASAATINRSYSYFSVHGTTLSEIQDQLEAHGPHVASTGKRHAGATRMQFTTRLTYGRGNGRCRIVKADVVVKAHVILPRWSDRSRADSDVQLIWDTLAQDIRRHEESHLSIAKNHARELEDALRGLYPQADCADLARKAAATSSRILAEHDAEQQRFDRIENMNFETRLLRLLRYRLQQIQAAQVVTHRR